MVWVYLYSEQRRKPLESFSDSSNVLNLWLLERGYYSGQGWIKEASSEAVRKDRLNYVD